MTGLRWGILATGGIARAFTQDLQEAGLTVTAVGSRSERSAKEFAETFGIPHAYGSYDALVTSPEVDIVYVATPHPMHLAGAVSAIEAGKHVLIEKPITLDAEEARTIADLAKERGVLAMEAMRTRYLPHMARIREIIAAGTLGEIRHFAADHTQSLSTDPTHRLNALELGGGALLDLGIYPISLAWDVLGAPTTVRALGRLGETGADTEMAAILGYDSEALATVFASSRTAGANTGSIVGTAARIEIDNVWSAGAPFRVIAVDGTVLEEFTPDVQGRGLQYQAIHAEARVADGSLDSTLLPIEESVAIMRTLDEIRSQIGVEYPAAD